MARRGAQTPFGLLLTRSLDKTRMKSSQSFLSSSPFPSLVSLHLLIIPNRHKSLHHVAALIPDSTTNHALDQENFLSQLLSLVPPRDSCIIFATFPSGETLYFVGHH